MAEPRTFPEEHVTAPLVYRRISGFAIAGLIVAVIYALIVVGAGLMGLSSQTPTLLPIGIQLLFTLLGAGLSLAAIYLIRRSEGTLTGLKMAYTGWWLSVVFGLGYVAYYAATYIAVCQQADTFTQRWFEKLKQGKVNQAFLDTQPPAQRQKVNAEDEAEIRLRFNMSGPREAMGGRGLLDRFLDSGLVRAVAQGGPETQVEALGVKEWDYGRSDGYTVQRTYRVTTPEVKFEVETTALGSESRNREYEGRQWVMVFKGDTALQQPEISDLGKDIFQLRRQTREFIMQWGNKLIPNEPAKTVDLRGAYLDIQGASEEQLREVEAKARQKVLARLAASFLLAEPGPLANLAFYYFPSVPEAVQALTAQACYPPLFRQSGILQTDKVIFDDATVRDVVLKGAKRMFGMVRHGARPVNMTVDLQSRRPWRTEKDRLRLSHDCKVTFEIPRWPLTYVGELTITVESDPGSVQPARKRAWRIVSVELAHADGSRSPISMMEMGPMGQPTRPPANLPPLPPEYVQPETGP
jgi:hypothetical protein